MKNGHYWIQHPNGTKFVGLYEMGIWYCAGVANNINIHPKQIIGPVASPETIKELLLEIETVKTVAVEVLRDVMAIDEVLTPWISMVVGAPEGAADPKMREAAKVYMEKVEAILKAARAKVVVPIQDGLDMEVPDGKPN